MLPIAAELNALREGFQGVAEGSDALQRACDLGAATRALGLAFVKNQPLTSADFAVEGVDRWLRVWGERWLSRATPEQLERLAKFVFGVRRRLQLVIKQNCLFSCTLAPLLCHTTIAPLYHT